MVIDYDRARRRIIEAFCDGLLQEYGPERVDVEEREVEQLGPLYWDEAEQWTDPDGVPRRGRFKRKPSKRVRQRVEVPKGMPEPALRQFAEGMAEAFLEVLRIIEEGD